MAWVGGGCGSCLQSLGRRRFGGGRSGQREQKKRKDRVRAGIGRHRKRRYVDQKSESSRMTRTRMSPPPLPLPSRRSHSTFTREWGDKWTVTCSDDAKSLCKSLNFRNTSSSSTSFGTHSLLNSRLWVMAIPSLSLPSFPCASGRRKSLQALIDLCSLPLSPSLWFLSPNVLHYWKQCLASIPIHIGRLPDCHRRLLPHRRRTRTHSFVPNRFVPAARDGDGDVPCAARRPPNEERSRGSDGQILIPIHSISRSL